MVALHSEPALGVVSAQVEGHVARKRRRVFNLGSKMPRRKNGTGFRLPLDPHLASFVPHRTSAIGITAPAATRSNFSDRTTICISPL